jgi:hypothetical protein
MNKTKSTNQVNIAILAAAGALTSLTPKLFGAGPAPINWTTKTVAAEWCLGDDKPKLGGYHGASCALVREACTVTFAYNHEKVHAQSLDCKDGALTPYSVGRTWKGTWNDGGGQGKGFMNAGANFTVKVPGVSKAEHYLRINCDTMGRISVSGN